MGFSLSRKIVSDENAQSSRKTNSVVCVALFHFSLFTLCLFSATPAPGSQALAQPFWPSVHLTLNNVLIHARPLPLFPSPCVPPSALPCCRCRPAPTTTAPPGGRGRDHLPVTKVTAVVAWWTIGLVYRMYCTHVHMLGVYVPVLLYI